MSDIDARIRFSRPGFHLDAALALPREDGITALLGASGSGKSTVLRLLAGLERPQFGRIAAGNTVWFDSDERINLPPQRRSVGMVFQDYALFEHLTVAGNIGYGLAKAVRPARVSEWLERLQLSEFATRYPHQLSGGQRQRVALGRALATDPQLLLLDEPFSAIDVSLCQRLRAELHDLFKRLHKPVLFVTHDLDEAYQLADRVSVIDGGRILRAGTTQEVFDYPCSLSAARVLGWRNFLPIKRIDGKAASGAWGEVAIAWHVPAGAEWLGIAAKHVRLGRRGNEGVLARLTSVVERGAVREIECRLVDDSTIVLHRPWDEPCPAPGSAVRLVMPPQHLRPLMESGVTEFNPASGNVLCRKDVHRALAGPIPAT